MPTYMAQFIYSDKTWATLAKKPQDRSAYLRELLFKNGGQLIQFYYSLGDYDGLVIFEAPDETTATAIVIAANAADYLRSVKTTKLLTVDEAIEAMRKAGSIILEPPST